MMEPVIAFHLVCQMHNTSKRVLLHSYVGTLQALNPLGQGLDESCDWYLLDQVLNALKEAIDDGACAS